MINREREPITIFTTPILIYKRLKWNMSYSTFGFAFIMDENYIEVIWLCWYFSYKRAVKEDKEN